MYVVMCTRMQIPMEGRGLRSPDNWNHRWAIRCGFWELNLSPLKGQLRQHWVLAPLNRRSLTQPCQSDTSTPNTSLATRKSQVSPWPNGFCLMTPWRAKSPPHAHYSLPRACFCLLRVCGVGPMWFLFQFHPGKTMVWITERSSWYDVMRRTRGKGNLVKVGTNFPLVFQSLLEVSHLLPWHGCLSGNQEVARGG